VITVEQKPGSGEREDGGGGEGERGGGEREREREARAHLGDGASTCRGPWICKESQ